MGEYKEGLSTGANCTKCAFGVTTFGEGSTSKLNCSGRPATHNVCSSIISCIRRAMRAKIGLAHTLRPQNRRPSACYTSCWEQRSVHAQQGCTLLCLVPTRKNSDSPDSTLLLLLVAIFPAVLLPGYYAAQMDATNTYVLKTTICPQGYYCPGGAPNASFVPTQVTGRRLQQGPQATTDGDKIIPCPNGAWTVEPGASSLEQCRKYTEAPRRL